ncbi:MAG: hypothetical protein P8X50_09050 [Maritimibacter sp.]
MQTSHEPELNTTQKRSLFSSSRVENNPRHPFSFLVSGHPRGDARDVFKAYTLRDISPREIDEMVGKLRAAGYAHAAFLLELESHGEAMGTDKTNALGLPTEPTVRFNLIRKMRDNAEEARRRGELSAPLEQMARSFEWFETMIHGENGQGPWRPGQAVGTGTTTQRGA